MFGAALARADEPESADSPKTKRGVQGVYHYATGPFSIEPQPLFAPLPPFPVAAPLPLPAPLPVFPPPHFAPSAIAVPAPVVLPAPVALPAPVYKYPVPVVKVPVPVPVRLAYVPRFAKKYHVRVRIPPLLRLSLRD